MTSLPTSDLGLQPEVGTLHVHFSRSVTHSYMMSKEHTVVGVLMKKINFAEPSKAKMLALFKNILSPVVLLRGTLHQKRAAHRLIKAHMQA